MKNEKVGGPGGDVQNRRYIVNTPALPFISHTSATSTKLAPVMSASYLCAMNLRFAYLISVITLFCSCEKAISFVPDNADPLVVVEATIENGLPPTVILTRSVNYFSQISPDILANSFIRNANIQISNGTKTHQLKEYKIDGVGNYNLYYYSIDSANLSTAFVGEFSKSYSLKITVDGKEYTAITTIPALTKTIDSLWWLRPQGNTDTSFARVMARITDPPGYGNYVRYFTKRNSEPFLPGRNSAFDDQIVDGTTYDIQVDQGVNRNAEIDEETYAFFKRGDTVTVKQANIDKATYDFWRTIEYSYASIGNPFSSPTKVLSNIKGGALGYFGGYAAQYASVVIPK